MTRRVVFAGGILARALAKAYRLDIAADRDEDVFFIGADAVVRDAAHRVISAADIVVTDLTAHGPTVPDHLIADNTERVAVPVVVAPFLWPFAGRAHPRNTGIDALPEGPYPAEFGDSFLDAMIAEGVDEDTAVARYLALDVAEAAGLDTLLETTLAEQAALDAQAGLDVAGFIHDEFRTQNLFATLQRLRLPLFRHIAAGVFTRMGIDPMRADALLEAPFAPGAAPIHPGVLAHFGMAVPVGDHRYPMLDEGVFTFEQYCRRYLRYEWNERLHRAMKLAETNPGEAIPALRRALDASPGSKAGQIALEDAERAVVESTAATPVALGAPDEARTAEMAQAGPKAPIYAALDAPMPDSKASAALMPGSLPKSPDALQAAEPASSVFSPDALGNLPFPSDHPPRTGESAADDGHDVAAPDDGEDAPEQQAYVELPQHGDHDPDPVPAASLSAGNRYTPLPPSAELIEVLPRMLPSTRGLADAVNSPFAAMPETMPPPPLRPVLPPELRPEAEDRKSLLGRLFGRS